MTISQDRSCHIVYHWGLANGVFTFARGVLKMSFTVLSGLLAGSVTDPPALAFANNLAKSDAPTVACATVYPLTTLLRILCAQILGPHPGSLKGVIPCPTQIFSTVTTAAR